MEACERWNFIVILVMVIGRAQAQLSENFYSGSCPFVEVIVRQAVMTKFSQTFVTAQATLRLFFHDCFVQVSSTSVSSYSPSSLPFHWAITTFDHFKRNCS